MTQRVCCVRNCDFNPSPGDKENRRTVFKFCEVCTYVFMKCNPKKCTKMWFNNAWCLTFVCINKLQKSPYFKTWINAIGPNLKDGNKNRKNYYICERHFDDSNFDRNPINILKDGKEFTMPRQRLKLKSTSVPNIFPVSIKVTCDLWCCCIYFFR